MNSEKVKIGSKEYVIEELTMRHIMPLIEKGDSVKLSLEVSKMCVKLNGQTLGDKILDLSFSEYQKIMTAVNRVHAFGEDEKND